MKKRSVLAIGILFIVCSFVSAQSTGALTIFSEDGERFYVILNGQRQNNVPQTNVRVEGLTLPNYTAKIIFEDGKLPEINRNYLSIADGNQVLMDATYKIKHDKNGMPKLGLMPTTFIPYKQINAAATNPVPPGATFESTTVMGNVDQQNSERERLERERREHAWEEHRGCAGRPGMTPENFTSALNTIRNENFDDTKLSAAKQIAGSNCMSVAQIAEICRAFAFEDRKLNFAKFAYDHCTEPGNYFKINNVFTFSSSVDDLNKYLSDKQAGAVNGSSMLPNATSGSTTVMSNGDQLNNDRERMEKERLEHERIERERREHKGCAGRVGMSTEDFAVALNTIKNESFDDNKLSTAKQIASGNCLTTSQIAEICRAFGFEDRKLNFAKFAYDHCTEPGNYFKINNVFTFSSSVDDLNKYIQGKQ